jgi:hypothetical protein
LEENSTLGRVQRLKIEIMATKFPKVPYLSATLLDWYIAIAIVGGNEPFSIVLNMGLVSLMFVIITNLFFLWGSPAVLRRTEIFSLGLAASLEVSADVDDMLEVFSIELFNRGQRGKLRY